MQPVNNLRENVNKLPEACAIYHIGNRKPIILHIGENGFYPADYLDTAEKVQAFNQAHKATAAMICAMEIGSFAGFHVPGANPDSWTDKPQALAKFEAIAYKPVKGE